MHTKLDHLQQVQNAVGLSVPHDPNTKSGCMHEEMFSGVRSWSVLMVVLGTSNPKL